MSVREFECGSGRLRFFEEAPRRRTIFVKQLLDRGFPKTRPVTVLWPYTIFVYPRHDPANMTGFFRSAPLPKDFDTSEERMVLGRFPNNYQPICFGNMETDVRAGNIDPRTAFWNSMFYNLCCGCYTEEPYVTMIEDIRYHGNTWENVTKNNPDIILNYANSYIVEEYNFSIHMQILTTFGRDISRLREVTP